MATRESESKYLAFGCSYTQYGYPTYADFIGQHFDRRENLGHSGAGNRYIFHKVVATINTLKREKVKLTENDLITIQWSGLPREDKILNKETRYPCAGYLGSQGEYEMEYINRYFSLEQNFFELVNYINILNDMFKTLPCQYRMFFMMDFDKPEFEDFYGEAFMSEDFNERFGNIKNAGYFKELTRITPHNIQAIESYRIEHTMDKESPYCYSFRGEGGNEICDDTHPTPYSHYEYAKYLSSKLDVDVINKNPIDYSSLFKHIDHMHSRENVTALKAKGITLNEIHNTWEEFNFKQDNIIELSRYRSSDISEFLKNYRNELI